MNENDRDKPGHDGHNGEREGSAHQGASDSPNPSLSASAVSVPSSGRHRTTPPLYGVMAEFDNPSDLVVAARETYGTGYRRINGYSPFPIEELSEAIGFTKTSLPLIVLIGGIVGGLSGFFMQYWMEVVDYPLNVGGKPYNSWPAFIPITFEMTVLFAAFAAVFGMLALNKLPQPYHPVFNAPNFALATRDRFFLVIEANDPKFKHEEVTNFMKNLSGARDVTDVEV
jgi:ActD protein